MFLSTSIVRALLFWSCVSADDSSSNTIGDSNTLPLALLAMSAMGIISQRVPRGPTKSLASPCASIDLPTSLAPWSTIVASL